LGFRRGFKAEANRIALRLRLQEGLSEIDPIDPSAICARYEIALIPLTEIDPQSPFLCENNGKFSAVTVPRGHQTAIVHNDSHHPHRQRSNICHELAHCFLGHKYAPPLTEEGERTRDGGAEAEANFLGGAMLITNEAALHIISNRLIYQAQAIYGVSKPMLDFRLKVSGAHTIYNRRMKRNN